ncbi:Crp/Fnr family transcriptional regulator [Amphritea balenae]|uniref:Crp/Fnr family transcriptional regulator n=1 Tax=Amphritea balenae TaxID=452629 RepID=A0A3P1SQW5_9GAMM|nr:Crp/Fnr family transcriptional regulator [Amphritea balenae]RRC99294.1 Crp/Fnr family transcriptional regulator [Amphritea balenae]GGK72255.1 hypothetical protein GCM10007941_22880 [Amphritea balenae]
MITSLSAQELLQLYSTDYFKNASTFGALSDDALLFLLDKSDILLAQTGDRIFSFGDPVDCFYVVLDGRVGFYKPCRGGRTHIRDYEFGMEVGFMAMIGLHDRAGDGDAEELTLLLRVSTAVFSEIQQKLPNDFGILLLNLAREMARRLRDADNRLADVE